MSHDIFFFTQCLINSIFTSANLLLLLHIFKQLIYLFNFSNYLLILFFHLFIIKFTYWLKFLALNLFFFFCNNLNSLNFNSIISCENIFRNFLWRSFLRFLIIRIEKFLFFFLYMNSLL